MIIKLHQNLINKIAAGEVVERPASVLKELLENSIDAKSTKITVNIEKAGTELIEVIDNGEGMSREDAKLACQSHTTSKITTIQDLDEIATMGFRGEALASISSVSALTLVTKDTGSTTGTKVIVDKKQKLIVKEVSTNKGTKITVKRLFHNIPARKKFLKTESTEYKHILVTFINYALAFPNIHFNLAHNKKSVYNLPSISKDSLNEELKIRINDLFGSKIASNLVDIHYNAPDLQIFGFVGHPRIARSGRSHQLVFLNNRPINDKLITKAVYDAYHSLIPRNKYPIFFLFLRLDPTKVDINVHPRKSEVRFADTQSIFQAVKQAAKQSLLKFLKKDAKKALEQYPEYKPKSVEIENFQSQSKPVGSRFIADNKDQTPTQQQISGAISFTKELLNKKMPVGAEDLQPFSSRAFQLFNTYIIIEKDDKILFIDQHAAAERVTYEKLLTQFRNDRIETQKLLLSEVIELDKLEFQSLKENRNDLSKLGIKLSIFGKSAFKVEEIPLLLVKSNIKELISDILSELTQSDESVGDANPRPIQKTQNHLIATMACHTSIRAGMKLKQVEIDDLVNKLLKCKNPYSCPHGRPIIWELSREELEKNFKRK
ncbi:DNA mismatch repair endonuclease MutL [Patescibacteria group bacterium]